MSAGLRSKRYKRRRSQAARGLPIIDTCDGCGACCLQQESPPGYLIIALRDEAYDEEDRRRYEAMPEEARREIEKYAADLGEHGHPNNNICIWFDEETRKCRYYEHRPSICRDALQVGDAGCRSWRQEYGIE